MKNKILFLWLFISFAASQQSFAQESWTNLALGTGDATKHFNNVAFAGAGNDTVFAVARNRAIWRSIDKGATWAKVHDQTVNTTEHPASTTNDFLWGIGFVDHLTGFVSGGRSEGATAKPVLLKTTDGGDTWADVTSSLPQGILEWGESSSNAQCLYGIHFTNAANGYIYGKSGAVIKIAYDDGDWTLSLISLGDYGDFRGLDFAGTTAFVAADMNKLQKRISIDDSGEAWAQVNHGGGSTYDVKFFDSNNGLCATATGGIYKTTDGGATWTSKTSGLTQVLFGVTYVDANTVYIVGDAGKVVKSTDGGDTWSEITSGTNYRLFKAVHKDGVVVAAGLHGSIVRYVLSGDDNDDDGNENTDYKICSAPFGTNLSGGEFGGVYPGVIGTHYGYPTEKCLDYFKSKKLKLIRFPFRWERIQRTNGTTLNNELDQTELERLKTFIGLAEEKDMKIIPDMHNFARYSFNGGSTQTRIDDNDNLTRYHLGSVWKKLALEFKNYTNIWAYDIMNEPYNMQGGVDGGSHWKSIAQVVIDSIRSVDTETPIVICGDRYSSSLYWVQASDKLKDLIDPSDKLIYSAHIYFDKDQSGSYKYSFAEEEANAQTGVERARPFVEWLKKNGKNGFVGEYGIPTDEAANDKYLPVLDNMLKYLSENGVPGTYWSAGPRWTETNPHTLSVQPQNNYTTDKPQMEILAKYTETCSSETTEYPEIQTSANLSIYPNPTTDMLYINTSEFIRKISLKNISGQIFLEQMSSENSISLKHLPHGIYLLRIWTENEITDYKIIKK